MWRYAKQASLRAQTHSFTDTGRKRVKSASECDETRLYTFGLFDEYILS
jgi:hypothetical protein